jgi:hypothetical protein
MDIVGICVRKTAGLLGRILLWQVVAMPVHVIGAMICLIIYNEIVIQGWWGVGFLIGLLADMMLISAFVYFWYVERMILGMWADKSVFAIFLAVILSVDAALVAILILFSFILAIIFQIYFGSPVLFISQCNRIEFFDRIDRCRGRDFGFMQARDRAYAARGKPSFKLSRLGITRPPEKAKCKTPESFAPIACQKMGISSKHACYFCSHYYATHDTSYDAFIVRKGKGDLIYLHSMNVDFRNEQYWPDRLSRYFYFFLVWDD